MKIVLAPLIALLSVGCGLYCTEIGCISGLTFNIDIADDGDWALLLDTGEELIECEFSLPDDAGPIGCDDSTVWLNVEDLGAGEYAATLQLAGAPEAVALSAWLDGELVDEVTESPEYSEYFPNGKRCDWESPCLGAEVELSLVLD